MDKTTYLQPVTEDVLVFFESSLLSGSPGAGGNEDAGDNPYPVF